MQRIHKEYLGGVASGKLHMPNDPLCKANLEKIKTAINDASRPLVQAYWRGYKDGMENTKEFYHYYFGY